MRGLVAGALVAALAADVHAVLVSQVHYVMGTYLRVTTDDEAPRSAIQACFTRARELDRVFSRCDPASELVRLNANGGGPASTDVRALLRRSFALRDLTDGTFDVTVAVGHRAGDGRVRLDRDGVLLGGDVRLDFDGLAKGYAVDECVARLRAGGVRRALVVFGESSIAAIGTPPGRAVWELALRGPDPELAFGTLRLRDEAASVSAVFGSHGRRRVDEAGHIVDPRSGEALGDDVVGVVVASNATDAEAYSKALLVWGVHGIERVERLPAVRGARVTRAGVERGRAMARSGGLEPYAHPRPLVALETVLR